MKQESTKSLHEKVERIITKRKGGEHDDGHEFSD
jgi:hypothetical protein